MYSDYIRKSRSSSPEYYPERFSRSRLNDATSFEKRTTVLESRKRRFEDDEALQIYSRESIYYSRDYELCSSPWIINMKEDTSHPSSKDICLSDMAVSAKRRKSSEVHENLLTSENYQNGLQNTKLKNHKVCKKHSKKETTSVNVSGENAICHSKTLNQLQQLENDLKLMFANKSGKNTMKLNSASKSNTIKSSRKLKSAQKSESSKNSMEFKSASEVNCIKCSKKHKLAQKSVSSKNNMELKSPLEPNSIKSSTKLELAPKPESFKNSLELESNSIKSSMKLEANSIENRLKLELAQKSVSSKNNINMEFKSPLESNSIKSSMKLELAPKSVSSENSVELKSAQQIYTESNERKNLENKPQAETTKSCYDIDDDADTLILCIDEDEADEILFGDLKSKALKSFKEHRNKTFNQGNT